MCLLTILTTPPRPLLLPGPSQLTRAVAMTTTAQILPAVMIDALVLLQPPALALLLAPTCRLLILPTLTAFSPASKTCNPSWPFTRTKSRQALPNGAGAAGLKKSAGRIRVLHGCNNKKKAAGLNQNRANTISRHCDRGQCGSFGNSAWMRSGKLKRLGTRPQRTPRGPTTKGPGCWCPT